MLQGPVKAHLDRGISRTNDSQTCRSLLESCEILKRLSPVITSLRNSLSLEAFSPILLDPLEEGILAVF